MFRKALIRLGVGLLLLASVTVLATASGGSAGLTFVDSHESYSHDGGSPPNPCPGPSVNERHYCLVVTNYDGLKQSGGVEVDVTLQNYDQSSLTNPTTKLEWDNSGVGLSLVSSDGPATCTAPTTGGPVTCIFPNLPGLGSAAGSGAHTPCPVPPVRSGPICSTVKLFFTAAATASSVDFSATADVKESNQQNGANLDQQVVAQAVMAFDNNTGAGLNRDATVVLPTTPYNKPHLLSALGKASVDFTSGSAPFIAELAASSGGCFPGVSCTGLQVTTNLSGASSGTFSAANPILWTAEINATSTNVFAVHYYDPIVDAIMVSPTPKTFTTAGTSFASCDGVNFGSTPPGNLVANQDYYAINRSTDGTNTSFQVATSATGKALSFTGSGPFSGSCIRIIGDQKSEKISGCTSAPPPPPTAPDVPPALCAVKLTNSTVRVYLWDAANGKISY